jgi:bifunctional enzyme CysN/CysC
MIGDVDAGKSTILGRLLVDLGQILPEKLAELESSSTKRGVPIEYSFLLDAFQLERDQAITLDISRIWVRAAERDYVFVDAPGHRELIRNLLSGASEVDAAVLVVAADEGITLQTRRQALFLQWFGFRQVLVAINKLDLAADAHATFRDRSAEVAAFLEHLGMKPSEIVPIAARSGENIVHRGELTPWWKGPTLLEAFAPLQHHVLDPHGPLRFVVQDVYRRGSRRLIAGRLDSGTLRKGERIIFWPLQASANVVKIERWPGEADSAHAGDSIAVELDARIFVDRGAVGSHGDDGPQTGHVLQATVVWLGQAPLRAGQSLRLRLGTHDIPVIAQHIDERIDADSMEPCAAEELSSGDVGVISLVARELVSADVDVAESSMGRFVLVRDNAVVAGGRIRSVLGRVRGEGATNVIAAHSSVTSAERKERARHSGGLFWLTGLPSAGKSTIAMAAQRMLFDRGYNVYVLDGDTLRTTLNADLGFSDEDRAENVRRTAAVGAVFVDAGFVVISALISPFAADRQRARDLNAGHFHEIYVACDLATAEKRDVKGLYRRARMGELSRFTGVSSPYEIPEHPDLIVDALHSSIEESAAAFVEYIIRNTR